MTRQEIPNNSPEQVRTYIAEAIAVVDELQVPDELRVAAFEQAVQLFAGKQILMQAPQPIDLGQIVRGGRGH